jgi:hypothetical protein
MSSKRLFHAFRSCGRSSYVDAGKEIATTVIASLLPLWLGLITAAVLKDGSPRLLLKGFLQSNEALLVSAALVGPLIYTIKKYSDFPYSRNFNFPYGLFFLLTAFVVCVIAAGLFGVSVAFSGSGSGSADEYIGHINPNVTFWISVVVLPFSILILFLVSSLRNQLDTGATQEMRNDTDKFMQNWREDNG